jgi:hypothetical protein
MFEHHPRTALTDQNQRLGKICLNLDYKYMDVVDLDDALWAVPCHVEVDAVAAQHIQLTAALVRHVPRYEHSNLRGIIMTLKAIL